MKPKIRQFTSLLSFSLIVITLTHGLTHSSQNIHTGLFPMLKEELKLDYYTLGLIAAIPPLTQTFLSIPAGMLSDKLGTKKMTIFSQILGCIGAMIAGLSQNLVMLIAAVSLLHLNTTFYHPPSYSYITKTFMGSDRSKALGIMGAGGMLGQSIGSMSISVLVGLLAFQWRQVYLFWLIPLLAGLLLVLKLRSEPAEDMPESASVGSIPETKSILSRSMMWFLIYQSVRGMGGSMASAFLSIYLVQSQGWSIGSANLLIGASSLMGLVATPLGGYFASIVGEKKWTTTNVAICSICFGLAFLIPNVLAFSVLYLCYGFFNLLTMASNSALTANLSPVRQRGVGFSLYFLPGSIMGAIAPMVAAFVANNYGLFPIFLTTTAIFLISVPIIHLGVKID